jgi:hypothetical protein
MIYTFNVRSRDSRAEPLETVHHAHGVNVMDQARALLDRYPECDGVEVMLLETRLFYMPRERAPTAAA